jgi:hypothetical protein
MADPKSGAQGPKASAATATGAQAAQGAAGPGAGPQTVVLQIAPPTPIDTAAELNKKPRATVAFPPCADDMLALIKSADSDDVTKYFNEYFKFRRHVILGQDKNTLQELLEQLADNLDGSLLNCLHGDIIAHRDDVGQPSHYDVWPSHCCLCRPCVTLDGNRNRPPKQYTTVPSIRRLFIGDALWLCYFERMGIFQILGAILDAFASNGRLPISNGSLDPGVKDDIIALVLEIMVRQTKMGMSSDVRGRASMYRTSLGWVSEPTRRSIRDSTPSSTSSFSMRSSTTATDAWRSPSRPRQLRAAGPRPQHWSPSARR